MNKIAVFVCTVLITYCQGSNIRSIEKHSVEQGDTVNRGKYDYPDKMATKVIAKSFFKLTVPQSLEELPTPGTDTEVWQYNDARLQLTIEAGALSARLNGSLENYPDYAEQWTSIDGERAKMVSFSYGEKSNLLTDPSMNNVVAAYFSESSRVKSNLIIWTKFASIEDQQIAKDIIGSLTFK